MSAASLITIMETAGIAEVAAATSAVAVLMATAVLSDIHLTPLTMAAESHAYPPDTGVSPLAATVTITMATPGIVKVVAAM